MPLFSIVIANYNYGRFLEDAIRSVLNQGMGDQVELIICDAASTDNSVEIIKKYAAGLPPNVERKSASALQLQLETPTQRSLITWWCSEPDGGQSAAFNKGFSHARGSFLTWLNADDVLLPGALKAIAKAISKKPSCEWFVGSTIWCDKDMFATKIFRAHSFSTMRLKGRCLTCCGPSSFFSRRLYDAVGGIDENMHFIMDNDLWYRFSLQEKARYVCVKDCVWAYRFHEESKMAGRVVDPDSEETKKRAVLIRAEADLLLERYGRPSALWRFLNRLPVSACDLVITWFLQRKYQGRHVNAIFKSQIVAPKVFLSNAFQEYLTGLREMGATVFAFNNWSRKKFENCPGLTFVSDACRTSVDECAAYVVKNGITVLYAQGARSLFYFAKVRSACGGRRPTLISNCHTPSLWDNPLRSFIFIIEGCLLADGLVFLVEKTRRKWLWLCKAFGLSTWHVPNPVDLNRFECVKQRTSDAVVIGCIGSVGSRKCQGYLVEIVHALRRRGIDARARIVGDVAEPDYKESIAHDILRLGLSDYVSIEPILEYDRVPEWMQSLDIYVCPSKAEVMPFSILEAMASGLPVVAHDIAGIHEQVRDDVDGYLIRSTDIRHYVEACSRILSNWQRFSKGARNLAESDFSTKIWARIMDEVVL